MEQADWLKPAAGKPHLNQRASPNDQITRQGPDRCRHAAGVDGDRGLDRGALIRRTPRNPVGSPSSILAVARRAKPEGDKPNEKGRAATCHGTPPFDSLTPGVFGRPSWTLERRLPGDLSEVTALGMRHWTTSFRLLT